MLSKLFLLFKFYCKGSRQLGLSSNHPEIAISQPNLNTDQTSSQVFGDAAANQVEHAHDVNDSGELFYNMYLRR